MRLPAAVLAVGAVQAAAVAFAPQAEGFALPLSQRLLYVHVPFAWASYAAWAVIAGAGAFALVRKDVAPAATIGAAAAAAAAFSFAAIATGIVWAREFGLYDPFRDAKLIATAVLCVWAGSIVLLERTARDDGAERLLPAVAVLGAFTVPASYFASRISVHPDFTAPGQGLDGLMWTWLLVATAATLSLLWALVTTGTRLRRLESAAKERP